MAQSRRMHATVLPAPVGRSSGAASLQVSIASGHLVTNGHPGGCADRTTRATGGLPRRADSMAPSRGEKAPSPVATPLTRATHPAETDFLASIPGLDRSENMTYPGRTERVAIYEYRCSDCGIFERSMPMGTATESANCPTCGRDANRVFSEPMTYRTPKPLAATLAREEASRDHPEVVERVPASSRHRRPAASQDLLARTSQALREPAAEPPPPAPAHRACEDHRHERHPADGPRRVQRGAYD